MNLSNPFRGELLHDDILVICGYACIFNYLDMELLGVLFLIR